MNIGNITISPSGHVFLGLELIGTVIYFRFDCSIDSMSGHMSLRKCESTIEIEEIARHLATHGIALIVDVYGQFWPNSFIKDDEWYIEKNPGEVSLLGVKAKVSKIKAVFPDDSMTGVY